MLANNIGAAFQAAGANQDPLAQHPAILEIVKGIYDMNVTMASVVNVTNRQSRRFGDVYSTVETQGQTSGKGSGQTAVQLKAELSHLKQEVEVFGAQIASIFTHIDQKFNEMFETDSKVTEVNEKVVEGARGKFDESS